MGFILYEKTGTFNPLDHGLSVGDVITVVVVGAGGGGAGITGTNENVTPNTTESGTVGGTSSFGSIVSALGGGGGEKMTWNGMLGVQSKQGQMLAAPGSYIYQPDGAYGYGSAGGGGYWFDGSVRTQRKYGDLDSRNLGGYFVDTDTENNNNPLGIGGPQAKGGKPGGLYAYGVCGPGGGGYGAGGGGAYKRHSKDDPASNYDAWVWGGNSGEVKIMTYKLTSVSSIPVTVGLGGKAGGPGLNENGRTFGGDGADGCVAVFW